MLTFYTERKELNRIVQSLVNRYNNVQYRRGIIVLSEKRKMIYSSGRVFSSIIRRYFTFNTTDAKSNVFETSFCVLLLTDSVVDNVLRLDIELLKVI